MIFSPNLPQGYNLTGLLGNQYFAPDLEHLVINDVLDCDVDDDIQLVFTSLLLSFADMEIQPSSGGNAVKRRELMKDIIVFGDCADIPLPNNRVYCPDDNKVSNLAGFVFRFKKRYALCESNIGMDFF